MTRCEAAESAQTTETTSDEVSLKMTPDSHDKGGSTSPLIPTVAMHLRPESRQLPEGFAFPEEVYTDANRRRLDKLTAMAKGHLTRNLLKVCGVPVYQHIIHRQICPCLSRAFFVPPI